MLRRLTNTIYFLQPGRELLLSHFGDKSVNALSIGPILHAMGQYKQKSTYTVSLSIQIERNKSFVPGTFM